MKEFIIRQLVNSQRELDSLKEFLSLNQLPVDDLKLSGSLYLTYYNTNDDLVGSGGLEYHGDKVLLRSIAVSQTIRSQSLGKQIVQDLIEQVKLQRKKEIYLLTTTALYFFLKFGFVEIKREDVPDEIKLSTEFSQLCPATAHVMKFLIN